MFPDQVILMKWNIAVVTGFLWRDLRGPSRPLKLVLWLVFTPQYQQYTANISTQPLWPDIDGGGGVMSAAPVLDNNC